MQLYRTLTKVVRNVFKLKTKKFLFTHFIFLLAVTREIFRNMHYPALSESFEVVG